MTAHWSTNTTDSLQAVLYLSPNNLAPLWTLSEPIRSHNHHLGHTCSGLTALSRPSFFLLPKSTQGPDKVYGRPLKTCAWRVRTHHIGCTPWWNQTAQGSALGCSEQHHDCSLSACTFPGHPYTSIFLLLTIYPLFRQQRSIWQLVIFTLAHNTHLVSTHSAPLGL